MKSNLEKIYHYARLMRITHWIKNFLVFVPLVFSFKFSITSFIETMMVFGAFCAATSAVYILNDIIDRQHDKKSPLKKMRPIAAGIVKVQSAIPLMLLLGIVAVWLGWTVSYCVLLVISLYLLLNALYSIAIKHIPLFDIITVAGFFVMRIVAGALAIGVSASSWLLICAFCLALFVAMGKRFKESDFKARYWYAHARYAYLIKNGLTVMAGLTILLYAVYATSSNTLHHFQNSYIVFTVIPAALGVLRYTFLLRHRDLAGDFLEILYRDRPLLGIISLWCGLLAIACLLRT